MKVRGERKRELKKFYNYMCICFHIIKVYVYDGIAVESAREESSPTASTTQVRAKNPKYCGNLKSGNVFFFFGLQLSVFIIELTT